MQEIAWTDPSSRDVVWATHSGGSGAEPQIVQEGGRTEDDKLQHRLSLAGAVSISLLEDAPSCEVLALPATSPEVRGSDSEVSIGAEQEWEIYRDAFLNLRAPSLDVVHMIIADGDENSTFNHQPHIQIRNAMELGVESPYPTLADSSAGSRSDTREQLIEGRGTRLPSPVSLEPNSAPVVAAATGLELLSSTHFDNGPPAKVSRDEPGHAAGVARTVGSFACRARSKRVS
jgi:hypothetical protein